MSLRDGLYHYLAGRREVVDLVGLDADGVAKVFPVRAPKGVDGTRIDPPYLLVTVVSNPRDHHQLGASGLSRAIVQFDAYADDPETASAITNAVRLVLDGKRRKALSNGIEVVVARLQEERDGDEDPVDGSDDAKYRSQSDYLIWAREPLPIA